MPDQWFEKNADGTLSPLTLLGEADGEGGYIPLQLSIVGDPVLPSTPLSPALTGSMASRTSATLSWTLLDQGSRPPVTSWVVERRQSVDNGVSYGSYSAISGSPFNAATLTRTDASLPIGTPEITFDYRVAGVNGDGQGDWSRTLPLQYGGALPVVPEKAFGLAVSAIAATSVTLTWDFPADATVTKQAIYKGNVLVVDNLDKLAKSYKWTGLVTDVAQANINIRRLNVIDWSTASNYVTFTPTSTPAFVFAPLIGCSASSNDHGGTDAWDAWRVYSYGSALTYANRTGVNHPKVLGVTESGMYTDYTTPYNYWVARLEEFYYTTAGAAGRQNVELHIGNGNEYADKVTAGNMAGFVQGCRGIYEATRVLNGNGTRRYPLASSWLDPTSDQELATITGGLVPGTDQSIYKAVPYLDGVAWSMYPPGRQSTNAAPTLEWPSFDYELSNNSALAEFPTRNARGFLARCFRRTYEAQDPAFNTNITSFHPLKIACWEVGTGDFPLSQSIRPYWAVHGLMASLGVMAKHYDLEMTDMCWWDQQKAGDFPQNILSDEPVPGAGQISTRVALQNWATYNQFNGGTRPSDWPASGPPNSWPNRNNAWKDEWVAAMNAAWPL